MPEGYRHLNHRESCRMHALPGKRGLPLHRRDSRRFGARSSVIRVPETNSMGRFTVSPTDLDLKWKGGGWT